jgi:protein-arginine kinase activator protein McsA
MTLNGGLRIMNRVYDIYSKNECLYHSLEKEEFEEAWEILSRVMNNLSFEEHEEKREVLMRL